ncbi:dUTP diphosphatase [Helicobacter sp.]|uniref:dUTP diphosphatase n=1 Tax=Helicobacter sp. TaxID=218 RepID=UPI00388D445B
MQVAQVTMKLQKLDSRAIIPRYQSAGASGFDFHALEATTIPAGDVGVVRTGLAMELAQGLELQIRPRSGLAVKSKISVLNTPGTIDSDYRGEIMVILINHGKSDFAIQAGDRIAQGVVAQVCQVCFEVCLEEGELSPSERGAKGFGSSGV